MTKCRWCSKEATNNKQFCSDKCKELYLDESLDDNINFEEGDKLDSV